MAPHSSTLAWEIPWAEEPGGLQSTGSRRARHDWATSLSLFTFMHWRRIWQPTPVFLLENPRDRGAWWAAVSGVTQSRTQLKWLSSSVQRIVIISCLKFRTQERSNITQWSMQHWQPPLLHTITINEIYSECLICFLNISKIIIQAPFLMLSREYQNDQYGKWIKYSKVWELVITTWVNNSF